MLMNLKSGGERRGYSDMLQACRSRVQSQCGRGFRYPSRPAPRPTPLAVQAVTGLSWKYSDRERERERDVVHPRPPTSQVINGYIYISTPPSLPAWYVIE